MRITKEKLWKICKRGKRLGKNQTVNINRPNTWGRDTIGPQAGFVLFLGVPKAMGGPVTYPIDPNQVQERTHGSLFDIL